MATVLQAATDTLPTLAALGLRGRWLSLAHLQFALYYYSEDFHCLPTGTTKPMYGIVSISEGQ
jgi:hypothetical protein